MLNLIPKEFIFSVLCFDLDDTILDNSKKTDNKTIKKFREQIISYKNRGSKIIYATARNKKDSLDAISTHILPDADYLITDLGLNLYEKNEPILDWNNKKNENWDESIINDVLSNHKNLICRKPERSGVFKKTYYIKSTDKLLVNELKKLLTKHSQKVDVYKSGDKSIYVVPYGTSKGSTLNFLIKKLGILKNEVVVAGDSHADYSLFKSFKNSILVGNAVSDIKKDVSKKFKNVYISKLFYTEGLIEGLNYYDNLYHNDIKETIINSQNLLEQNKKLSLIKVGKDNIKNRIIKNLIKGYLYERQGYFIKSKKEYVKSLRISDKTFDVYIKDLCKIQIAKNDISLGNLEQGIKFLKQLNADIKDLKLLMYVKNALAYGYRLQGKTELALKILLKLEKESKKTTQSLSILHNLAGLYRDLKKYKKSLNLYENILKHSNSNDDFSISRLYNNIGFIYRRLGDYVKAEKYYLISYKLECKIGSKQLQGRTLNNLGGVNRMNKKYQRALLYFEKSITLRKSIGDKSGLSSSLLNKGIVLGELKKTNQAKHFLNKSYSIRRDMGSSVLINEVLNELKKYD